MPSAADSGAFTRGEVLEWYAEEGWGVLTSPAVDGTVFAHYSVILDQEGYRSLEKGQAVCFRWHPGCQDGCDNQAAATTRPLRFARPQRRGGYRHLRPRPAPSGPGSGSLLGR